MIVAKRKPLDEILEMLKGYKKVLNVGCGTCVSVCLAGGEKEVDVLNAELDMARKLADDPIEIDAYTVERQCDREYLAELDDKVGRLRRGGFHGLRCGHPVHGRAVSGQAGFPRGGHLGTCREPGGGMVRGAVPFLPELRAWAGRAASAR